MSQLSQLKERDKMEKILESSSFRIIGRDELDEPRIYVFDGDLEWLAYRLINREVKGMENFLLFCRRSFLTPQIKQAFSNFYSLTTRSQEFPLYINGEKFLPSRRTFFKVHPTPIGLAGFVGKYTQSSSAVRSRYQLSFILKMLFESFRPNDERIFFTVSCGSGDKNSLPEFLSETLRLENSKLIIATPDRGDFVQ